MDLAEFSKYYSLEQDVQDFLVKYGFNEIADRLEVVPASLSDEYLLNAADKLNKKLDTKQILEAAAEVRNDPFLLANYNFLCHYWLERSDTLMYGHKLAQFENGLENAHAGVYNLLAVLTAFEYVEKTYARLGLPPEVAQATLQYTTGAIAEYAAGNDNKLGINGRKLHWFRFYIDGKLFRIGRLEFMIQDPLPYLPIACRRNSDGKVIALCRNGWLLSKDGLQLFESDDPAKAYIKAKVEQTTDTISGIPINPRGFAEVDRFITLNTNEYTPLWNMWDLVPGVHIPGGGGMKRSLIEDSLRKARDFFPKYFNRKVAGFSCYSWIYNPDFEEELPNSNLADFMREVYLFPIKSVGVEGLYFVFGKSDKDWSDYPADNSLRLAFHRLREAGKRLKAGGMFIDADAVDNFGTQKYRNDYGAFDEL